MQTEQLQVISNALRNIGIDPLSSQMSRSDGQAWLVQGVGITMFVAIEQAQGDPQLQLTCPILYMPTQNLMPFYRKLLDLNSISSGASLATDKDVVYVIQRHNLDGLSTDAVETALLRTLKAADVLGDLLMSEFQTARYWQPM